MLKKKNSERHFYEIYPRDHQKLSKLANVRDSNVFAPIARVRPLFGIACVQGNDIRQRSF